jgi:hypothetical protein
VTRPRPPGVSLGGGEKQMYRKSWEDWIIIIGTLATVVVFGNL